MKKYTSVYNQIETEVVDTEKMSLLSESPNCPLKLLVLKTTLDHFSPPFIQTNLKSAQETFTR